MTKEELIDQVIWEAVMEGTAWCGWTDGARNGLVKSVQENVKWAMSEQGEEFLKRKNEENKND